MAADAARNSSTPILQPVDPAIVKLLRYRHRAGAVYLRGSEDRRLYLRAQALGLINNDGEVTAAGRSLLTVNANP